MAFERKLAQERRRHGEAIFGLDTRQLAEMRQAAERLPPGVSIGDVVSDWLAAKALLLPEMGISVPQAAEIARRKWEATSRSVPVTRAVGALLTQKKSDGMSVRWLSTLRHRLCRLAATFGERAIASVTADELRRWLSALPVGDQTRRHYRAAVSVLLRFSVERGWLPSVPQLPRLRSAGVGRPAIYTPAEALALLTAADRDTLAFLAFGLFCGLRSAETRRLRWQDVDWPAGVVKAEAHITKTARWRAIPIEPALRAWVEPIRRPEGRVVPVRSERRLYVRLRAIADRAGIPWRPNALRHSYGSYQLARLGDAYRVSELMGNSAAVVRSHYARLVSPADAEAFWELRPPQ